MGQLPLGSMLLPNRRFVRRSAGRENAHQASRDPFRRTVATTYKRENADPLFGKRGQSVAIPPRATRPLGKHGIPRHSGRKSTIIPRPYLDHYLAIPDTGYHDRGDG